MAGRRASRAADGRPPRRARPAATRRAPTRGGAARLDRDDGAARIVEQSVDPERSRLTADDESRAVAAVAAWLGGLPGQPDALP